MEEVEVEKCHEIDEYAFSYCKKLKEVQIGNIKRVKKYAFENCRSVKDFSEPLIKIGKKTSKKEKIEIDICYGRCSPFCNKYNGNFRLAYERYVKHDMFADYSDFSYSKYEIDDEQDLRLNYGRPSYSYFIKWQIKALTHKNTKKKDRTAKHVICANCGYEGDLDSPITEICGDGNF